MRSDKIDFVVAPVGRTMVHGVPCFGVLRSRAFNLFPG